MADSYKLVFRGEVLEGQHPAVVRKRLGESGGFDAAQLDKLFSGRPVVVKRAADTAVAARIQSMFRKAGARLRVLPVDEDESAISPQPSAESAAESEDTPAGATTGLQVLPPGSDLLRVSERRQPVVLEVDTSALSLEGATFTVADPPPAPQGPDVSHLSVAPISAVVQPRPPIRSPCPDSRLPSLERILVNAPHRLRRSSTGASWISRWRLWAAICGNPARTLNRRRRIPPT